MSNDVDGWRRSAEALIPLSDDWDDVRVERAEVCRILHCDEPLLDLLVEEGLPSTGGSGAFGLCDVMNIGLYSGSGRSVPELAERYLMRFSTRSPSSWIEPRTWRVSLTATCDCGETCPWMLPEPLPQLFGGTAEPWQTVSGEERRVRASLRARTAGSRCSLREPIARDAVEDMLEQLGSGRLRYQYLPRTLRVHPRAALARGAIDCVALSLHLEDLLSAQGLAVRTRKGYLLSNVAVEHAWVELIDRSGTVASIDPVLALLAARTPGADPAFGEFCMGSVSNRLLPWDGSATDELFSHGCGGAGHPAGRSTVNAVLSARAADG